MRLRTVLAATVVAQGVAAFRDTSPFFLFSTSRLPDSSAHLRATDDIATAKTIEEHVLNILHQCPSDTYLIINQPGASASDFAGQSSTPHLRRRLSGSDGDISSRHVVGSVIGDVGATQLEAELSRHCSALKTSLSPPDLLSRSASAPQIITVDLPSLPASAKDRAAALSKHDSYLNTILSSLPSTKYTVLYRTTPPSKTVPYESGEHALPQRPGQQAQLYEMDEPYPSSVHANNFKRDVTAYPRAAGENGTNLESNLPLFEKYSFLNAGIFMGGIVSLLLLVIVYVGISAVAGLEVSYMAFSKEMNPANQKKQQ